MTDAADKAYKDLMTLQTFNTAYTAARDTKRAEKRLSPFAAPEMAGLTAGLKAINKREP